MLLAIAVEIDVAHDSEGVNACHDLNSVFVQLMMGGFFSHTMRHILPTKLLTVNSFLEGKP
ncbi:hypothetical protein [Verminephrobacter aporrectodeae]|uniref:hypothetical protein n=1 Tax=Verminephrobacter aporrectodeae TaxID=1110389 RepID=UPI00223824A1|nr:hypothetical protein [Verminephrobacter aporrectodeae]